MEPEEEIHKKYHAEIYELILGLVEDADAAEDLTVETFVKAYRHRDRLRSDITVREWLHAVARNNVENWRRVNFGLPKLPDWLILVLERAIQELPEEYRSVFLLSQEGLTLDEIAERTGLSVPAVKVRLHRAWARIRRRIDGGKE